MLYLLSLTLLWHPSLFWVSCEPFFQSAFLKFDRHHSGKTSRYLLEFVCFITVLSFAPSFNLRLILWEAGVSVSNKVLECLVLRSETSIEQYEYFTCSLYFQNASTPLTPRWRATLSPWRRWYSWPFTRDVRVGTIKVKISFHSLSNLMWNTQSNLRECCTQPNKCCP